MLHRSGFFCPCGMRPAWVHVAGGPGAGGAMGEGDALCENSWLRGGSILGKNKVRQRQRQIPLARDSWEWCGEAPQFHCAKTKPTLNQKTERLSAPLNKAGGRLATVNS